jgi:hypothetical protein
MLYVSQDCPLYVSSSVVSNVYLLSLYCVLCIQCCMCLWIVHYRFPLRLSLTFTYCLCPVSCVCCMCLWIVHYMFPLRVVSNVYLLSLYCVLCIQCCMSLDCPLLSSSLVISNVYLLSLYCVLCMLYVSLDCPFLIMIAFRFSLTMFCDKVNVRDTEEETNNGQSRDTYNIEYTRHRTKTISKR